MGRESGRRFGWSPPRRRRPARARQRRSPPDCPDHGGERDRRRDVFRGDLRGRGRRPQGDGIDDDSGEGFQRLSLGACRRGRILHRRDRNPRCRFRLPSTTASADLVQRIIRTPRRSDDVAVTHELLRRGAVEERAYQVNIARACLERSTLVVLPTGMGKTVIAAMVIAEVLRRKGGKVLFLAPTKPLVEQHAASLRNMLVLDRIALFTGEATSPEERELLWRENKIVVSTPQVIRNDVRAERISLDDVSLVVFDEAHRAVGDYAYVDVAAAYKEVPGRLVLGMTASPGSSAEKILEVCRNLGITAVEIRTEYDPDVVPYLHGLEVQRIPVEAPDVSKEIRTLLQVVLEEQVERLKKMGFLAGKPKVSLKDLLAAGDDARKRLDSGVRDGRLYGAMTAQAIAMKANHAMELAETQGLGSLRSYFDKMEAETKSKAD
ncbi:MAG: DEAD/DEAH box helicase, partial [Methanobacteriota archaeon]